MFEKIKTIYQHPRVQQLRDVRSLGLVLFGFVAIIITWSGIKAVQANYGLQRQISKLEQENQVADLENTNLKLKNQYYETDQFLELAARRQFGKGQPGEKLLLVPKSVALAHTINTSSGNDAKSEAASIKPTYQKNFESWINFFLHRPNTD